VTLPEIHYWRDPLFRPASMQMALDDALFHRSMRSGVAAMRFYHWDQAALTAGYFHRSQSEPQTPGMVRRFTGGGLVEHGEDLTFVLTLPAGTAAARTPGADRYRWIHEALAAALAAVGFPAALEPADLPATRGPCFAHPVPWDLRDPESGRKIGGGAQRRSRGAVIHQGSIRLPTALRDPAAEWIDAFIYRLTVKASPLPAAAREEVTNAAATLKRDRYDCHDWNDRA
jgi:lipoyl(octanoyl) transferase